MHHLRSTYHPIFYIFSFLDMKDYHHALLMEQQWFSRKKNLWTRPSCINHDIIISNLPVCGFHVPVQPIWLNNHIRAFQPTHFVWYARSLANVRYCGGCRRQPPAKMTVAKVWSTHHPLTHAVHFQLRLAPFTIHQNSNIWRKPAENRSKQPNAQNLW